MKVDELLPRGIQSVGLPDLVIMCTCVELEVEILRTESATASDTQPNEIQVVSAVANLDHCRVVYQSSTI